MGSSSVIPRRVIMNRERIESHSHEVLGDLPFISSLTEIPFLLLLVMLQTLGYLSGL